LTTEDSKLTRRVPLDGVVLTINENNDVDGGSPRNLLACLQLVVRVTPVVLPYVVVWGEAIGRPQQSTGTTGVRIAPSVEGTTGMYVRGPEEPTS